MKSLFLFWMFVTGGLISPYAQQEASWMGYPSKTAHTKGQIHYQEDSRTSQLIEFLSLPQPPDNTVLMDGYRVQIYFNSDKQLIDEQRTKFSQTYPSIRAYIRYEAPNYSIKVGNFLHRVTSRKFPCTNIVRVPYQYYPRRPYWVAEQRRKRSSLCC